MPYIEIKTTAVINTEKSVELKSALGQAITLIPGKTEEVTMVCLIGGCDMYFGGSNDSQIAYIEVKMYKSASWDSKVMLNTSICEIIRDQLDVPTHNVYLTFHEQSEWGAKGQLI